MNDNSSRNACNGNQGCASEAGALTKPGSKILGHSVEHTARLGAGPARPSGFSPQDTSRDHRNGHGGQASAAGLFGVPAYPGVRRWVAPAPAQAKAEVAAAPAAQSQAPAAPAQAAVAVADKPLSFAPPRSRHGIHWRTRQLAEQNAKSEAARAAKAQTAPAPASASRPDVTPAPEIPDVTVRLERDRFRIFERIAAKENRSVKAIIAECLNGCSIQVARIEAQNIRLAAVTSLERERSGYYNQLDIDNGPSRPGYVEVCLALD